MGKYIRKAKLDGELVVMDVSGQSSNGVRTRARTLALQRLQKPSACPSANNSSFSSSSSSYLQLRSRRLEKPPVTLKPKELTEPELCAGAESSPETDLGAELSFGENALELEAGDRDARETTPCSLITKPGDLRTPGSATRLTPRTSFNRSSLNVVHHNIPSAHEIEEFFAETERVQQKKFMDKYNYDLVNDVPLPGRYEWVMLDSN